MSLSLTRRDSDLLRLLCGQLALESTRGRSWPRL